MSNHKFTRFNDTRGGEHFARCSCGYVTDHLPQAQQVEDQERQHLEYIERVKAHLGARNPSLKQQRDYYLDRAERDHNPKNQRMWRMLADELTTRLGGNAPAFEQPELFSN